jgi:hypothetical protein
MNFSKVKSLGHNALLHHPNKSQSMERTALEAYSHSLIGLKVKVAKEDELINSKCLAPERSYSTFKPQHPNGQSQSALANQDSFARLNAKSVQPDHSKLKLNLAKIKMN